MSRTRGWHPETVQPAGLGFRVQSLGSLGFTLRDWPWGEEGATQSSGKKPETRASYVSYQEAHLADGMYN